MSVPEQHQRFLEQKDYILGIESFTMFSSDELELLERYGHWLDALASGTIGALTLEQSQFIEVARWRRDPVHKFECTWRKLQIARERDPSSKYLDPRKSTSESDLGFKYPEPKKRTNTYLPCEICHDIQTVDGVACVSCRLKSGKLHEGQVCRSCKKVIISSGGICSNCAFKFKVSRQYLSINNNADQ
jgi:uncharacterized protein YifE (UPF0438 family)